MLNTKTTMTVVCAVDPAIDTEAMTAAEAWAYVRDRKVETLRFKPGMKPTRFVIRHLTRSQRDDVMSTCATDAARNVRAFRYALVEAIDAYDADGGTFRFAPSDTVGGVSLDELDAEVFSSAEIQDIGGVAWARSFLGRRITPVYRLPPLLLEHWAGLPCRSVVPSDAATNSSADSATPDSQDHAGPKTGARSEKPTDAPAMATTGPGA